MVFGAVLGAIGLGLIRITPAHPPSSTTPPVAAAPRATDHTEAIRHPDLCGVSFANGEYRFGPAHRSAGAGVSVSHWPGSGRAAGDPVVMHFDAPADSVDFLARLRNPNADARAFLVAFDALGRVVAVAEGTLQGAVPVSMRVTTATAVIRTAQFYLDAPASQDATSGAVVIEALDIGAHLPDCPAPH